MVTNLFVIDTSVLISAHLLPLSTPRRAYDKARQSGILVFSKATFHEFASTFTREKFEKYQSLEARLSLIELIERRSFFKEPTIKLAICRDPNDDMFLELAVSCHAATIVTSDPDLLALHPFNGINIFSPADFLQRG
jgi:putative PIN family toxin of toxin-antitoxin system